jgi:hypothetical protein
VKADAFYEKGYGVTAILKAIESLPYTNRQHFEAPKPIRIQMSGHDTAAAEFVTIVCPDCFREVCKRSARHSICLSSGDIRQWTAFLLSCRRSFQLKQNGRELFERARMYIDSSFNGVRSGD